MTNQTKKRRILAIRHGESEWNVLRRTFPGEDERYHSRMCTIDCNITRKGILQAKEAGTKLSEMITTMDLFLASPLRRALQTAELVLENFEGEGPGLTEICKEATEIMVDPCDIGSSPLVLSKEFSLHQWDFSGLGERWWYGGRDVNETLERMRDGEGLEEEEAVAGRIDLLKSILRNRSENVIVLVCHSDVIWWITREMKNEEFFGIKAENGEIIDITRYVLLDDSSHR